MSVRAPAAVSPAPCLLRTVGLSRHYPGVRALDEVDFDLRHGEVHVLFGENGAGKSTLISLLAGANTPTAGHIEFEGRTVHLHSVREARVLGISAVFQEFSLVPALSVADNLLLGDEPTQRGLLRHGQIRQRALELLARLEFAIDPDRRVGTLSRAEQQMVEIAKSLRSRLAVLILDEPTASLTEQETDHLFAMIERLRGEGVGIVYISHRLQEIRRIADRITVLRDGRKIATVNAAETDDAQMVELMTGRTIEQIYPHIESRPGETVLELQGLATASGVRNVCLCARRGEVLGLAGLVGHGKSELMRAVFGAEAVTAGRVVFKGEDCTGMGPAQMLARGLYYMPPDRKHEGLMLGFSCASNISLPVLQRGQHGRFGFIQRRRVRTLVEAVGQRVELAPRHLHRPVGRLSGGNQQKVLFGKGLAVQADLYIFDEPTVGVDVGTRSALYGLIKQLCEDGAAVIVVSSDLPEILHLAHRACVMRAGRLVGELAGKALAESAVLDLFFDRHAGTMASAA